MAERILIAIVITLAGLTAYRVLLFTQKRQAGRGAQNSGASGQPTLLVFTSPTCAPCKLQQMPIVERLAGEWEGRMDLQVIDVTERPEVAASFGVWSLPTTVVMNQGQEVIAINQGVASEQKLRKQLAPLFG